MRLASLSLTFGNVPEIFACNFSDENCTHFETLTYVCLKLDSACCSLKLHHPLLIVSFSLVLSGHFVLDLTLLPIDEYQYIKT